MTSIPIDLIDYRTNEADMVALAVDRLDDDVCCPMVTMAKYEMIVDWFAAAAAAETMATKSESQDSLNGDCSSCEV